MLYFILKITVTDFILEITVKEFPASGVTLGNPFDNYLLDFYCKSPRVCYYFGDLPFRSL